jgi:uncharacterized membrane protein (UPF0127 family)
MAGAVTTTTMVPVFSTASITVGGRSLEVWVADTDEEWTRGLMGIHRLPEGIDGLLFVFDSPRVRTFHMLQTPMPLDIWWFDTEAELIGSHRMEPCPSEPCPSQSSPGEVSWALETPQGDLELPPGAVLSTG